MGMMQRRKGATGEREIAAIVRDLTGWDIRRRCRQHDGDSDLVGVPGWSVEVKRHAKAGRCDIRGWWEQAAAQMGLDDVPVLFYRRDRDEWRAVWPVSIDAAHSHLPYAMTVEGSIDAWAMVAREMVK